eukprot:Clim_evm28s191 gene=Clim_evmTU28s191
MAKSDFEYVKQFEREMPALPNVWLVIRLDGRGFHKFTDDHDFAKPNDLRALRLADACAQHVMKQHPDVCISYGQSDEYSFVLRPECNLFQRRPMKLATTFAALFASSYTFYWDRYMNSIEEPTHDPDDFDHTKPVAIRSQDDTKYVPLQYPPAFDGRVVEYPDVRTLRDYLSWRQADCHINNLYNTVFWTLVQDGGLSPQAAEQDLCGTLSGDKNEILFSKFGINYNNLEPRYRKGSILIQGTREVIVPERDRSGNDTGRTKTRTKPVIQVLHTDLIREDFWREHPTILGDYQEELALTRSNIKQIKKKKSSGIK